MALSLPRFELRFGTTDLSAALKALGVEEAFQGDVGGAFDRMSDDPDTYLNAVFHQVWMAHQVLMSKKRSKQMDQPLNPMDQQLPATVLPI